MIISVEVNGGCKGDMKGLLVWAKSNYVINFVEMLMQYAFIFTVIVFHDISWVPGKASSFYFKYCSRNPQILR